MATFDDFLKLEMRVGTITAIEAIPETDKLLKLTVDCGEEQTRQIVSGIKHYFDDFTVLIGTQAVFVTNLEPRTIKGIESQGMILAVGNENEFTLLTTMKPIAPGSQVQ